MNTLTINPRVKRQSLIADEALTVEQRDHEHVMFLCLDGSRKQMPCADPRVIYDHCYPEGTEEDFQLWLGCYWHDFARVQKDVLKWANDNVDMWEEFE